MPSRWAVLEQPSPVSNQNNEPLRSITNELCIRPGIGSVPAHVPRKVSFNARPHATLAFDDGR